MKTFTTKTTVRLADGVLSLSPEQAAVRNNALEALGDGLYQVTGAVEFKAGETFGHDQPIPKSIANCLDETDELPSLDETDELPSLEDMDTTQLKAFATTIEAKFHPNAGKPKLIEAIKLRQDEMLAAQEADDAALAKLERIQELEAKGELAPEEQAELDSLKA
jgi:hypothetical protein